MLSAPDVNVADPDAVLQSNEKVAFPLAIGVVPLICPLPVTVFPLIE